MIGLPKATELHRQLPKKTIYTKFQMNTSAKNKIDTDISRITIINEVSPTKVRIAEGENVKSFFVVHVLLKRKDFDDRTVVTLSKIIHQNILFVLEYEDEAKLAIYHTKLMQTSWQKSNGINIELKGLNLDTVWENIVTQVGDIKIEQGNTLDKQIELDEKQQKLNKEIERIDKQARKEIQPKKKFGLVQEINKLKKEFKVNPK